MGDGSSRSDSKNLKNKEWSLFWGKFIEEEASETVGSTAQSQIDKISDISQSLSLHKKLLDVEVSNIHKEIEELAIQLSQERRHGSKALELRQRLKELFLIEENLNTQMDLLEKRMNQSQDLQNQIKGVS